MKRYMKKETVQKLNDILDIAGSEINRNVIDVSENKVEKAPAVETNTTDLTNDYDF